MTSGFHHLISNNAVHHKIAEWLKEEIEKRKNIEVSIVIGNTSADLGCMRQIFIKDPLAKERNIIMLEYTKGTSIKLWTWGETIITKWNGGEELPTEKTYDSWVGGESYDIADPKSLDKILAVTLKQIGISMKPHEITMSRQQWQSLGDAAESIGQNDQRVIMKIVNIIDSDFETKEVTISLWGREINEILTIVNNGKMYNAAGETVLKQAMEILENGKENNSR
jgi:hypothetical protein